MGHMQRIQAQETGGNAQMHDQKPWLFGLLEAQLLQMTEASTGLFSSTLGLCARPSLCFKLPLYILELCRLYWRADFAAELLMSHHKNFDPACVSSLPLYICYHWNWADYTGGQILQPSC